MKNLMILGLVLMLFACGNKAKAPESNNVTTNTPAPTGLANGHYEFLYVMDKDSSFLNLDVKDGEVTGNYTFLPEVSDGAAGEIKAKQTGNMIVGVHSFEVEGSKNAEKIYLEVKDKQILWKKYELQEDTQAKMMMPDTTKLVNTHIYSVR